jgi:hypothetical protein
MDKLSYRRHRFPGIVIQQAVWLYFRFALSYRDVEDMLAERGRALPRFRMDACMIVAFGDAWLRDSGDTNHEAPFLYRAAPTPG